MSREIQYFIFDFDGVTADTESVFAEFDCRLLNDVLAQAGANQRLEIHEVRALAGNAGEAKLALIAERYALDLAPYERGFIETRTEARKTLFKDHPAPLGKNLKQLLALLDGRYALATNKTSAKLFHDMNLMGIEELFSVIVPCDPPLSKKPAPDILIEAATQLNTQPENCAYIGDNALDMQAAKAAGMLAVGFIIEGKDEHEERAQTLNEAGADIIIDDFMDLKAYLKP